LNGHDIGIPVLANDLAQKPHSPSDKAVDDNLSTGSRSKFPLRVVHAPSDPYVKGSKEITRVLEKLAREGLVEFKLVIGLSNEQVQQALAWSDLLVDQLYSDLPLPVLASEAALHGVPTIIGSNDWSQVKKFFTDDKWPPAIHIYPDDLEEELRKHISNLANLSYLGALARSFVEEHRNPRAIASIYESIILEKSLSQSGVRLFDPKNISYVAGCGSSQKAIDEVSNHAFCDGINCWAK
jgi:glycosyltransferase involved in cell wall biosynthesis